MIQHQPQQRCSLACIFTLEVLLVWFHCNNDYCTTTAWTLQTSWDNNPTGKKSVLAISFLQKAEILATAGHEGGTIRFWKKLDNNRFDDWNLVATAQSSSQDVHTKSIFTLDSIKDDKCDLLLSGSLDRTAIVQQISFANNDDDDSSLNCNTVAKLPEHTGWVRDVCIVNKKGTISGDDYCYYLSIGCNLINVFTSFEGETLRLARLDAGPSSEDEEAFRRHDILCMTELSPGMIVAGLVDGTLRAFATRWEEWSRRTKNPLYDATGSCKKGGLVKDDAPFARVQAHFGSRVYGVHAIKHNNDDIEQVWSVGEKDCCLWKIRKNETFTLMSRVPIPLHNHNDKVGCSLLVDNRFLMLGTALGFLYQINLNSIEDDNGGCVVESVLWDNDGHNIKKQEEKNHAAITSLAWIPPNDDQTSNSNPSTLVVGSADGKVALFSR